MRLLEVEATVGAMAAAATMIAAKPQAPAAKLCSLLSLHLIPLAIYPPVCQQTVTRSSKILH